MRERIREHIAHAQTGKVCHLRNLRTGRAESIRQAHKRDIPHQLSHIQQVIRLCSTYLIVHDNDLQQNISQGRQRVRTLHRHSSQNLLSHALPAILRFHILDLQCSCDV